MRGKVCAVFGCSNYEVEKNARSFFRFPRDKKMCDLWVLKCHRSDFDKVYKKEGTLRLYKNYKICSDHFQASDFKNPRLYSQGPSCGYLLRLWAVLSFVLSILGLALAILAPQCEKMMMQHLRNSLHRGMGQYLHDPKWKTVLDLLQQSYDCCGSEHYTDWYRTAWLHSDQLREDTQTVLRYTEIDGRVLPPIVPWSCCDPMVKLPCLHDQLQQIRSRFVWQDQPELVLETIHTEGCLLQLRPPVQRGLDSVSGVLSLAFILQMAVMIIARFLYTSSRNALLQGDPDSAAWGWLWGRGDLGLALGKTLPQLDKTKEEKKAAKATMAAALDEMKNGTKAKEKDDTQGYEQLPNEGEEKKKKKKKKRLKKPFRSSNIVPEEEGQQLLPNEGNK